MALAPDGRAIEIRPVLSENEVIRQRLSARVKSPTNHTWRSCQRDYENDHHRQQQRRQVREPDDGMGTKLISSGCGNNCRGV